MLVRNPQRAKTVPFPTMFFPSQSIDNHLSTTRVTFKSLSHVVIFPWDYCDNETQELLKKEAIRCLCIVIVGYEPPNLVPHDCTLPAIRFIAWGASVRNSSPAKVMRKEACPSSCQSDRFLKTFSHIWLLKTESAAGLAGLLILLPVPMNCSWEGGTMRPMNKIRRDKSVSATDSLKVI